NPSRFGQDVTFTATVALSGAGTNENGIASCREGFYDGTTKIGSGTLDTATGTTASYSLHTLSVGSHPITATYNGDGNYNTSTSSALNQVVDKTDTTTTIVSNHNPSRFGQDVTFTATVALSGAGTN